MTEFWFFHFRLVSNTDTDTALSLGRSINAPMISRLYYLLYLTAAPPDNLFSGVNPVKADTNTQLMPRRENLFVFRGLSCGREAAEPAAVLHQHLAKELSVSDVQLLALTISYTRPQQVENQQKGFHTNEGFPETDRNTTGDVDFLFSLLPSSFPLIDVRHTHVH